ncbi:MAG: glycosyltransferase family 4 protein [Candidatus Methanofastidiosia archaeon]
MNIVMVNPSKSSRPEIQTLSGYLAKMGHNVSILQPEPVLDAFDYSTQNVRSINKEVQAIGLPSLFLPKIRYTIPDFVKEYSILSSLADKGADIIHVSQYFYPTVFPALFKKVPLVVSTDALVGISWSYNSAVVDTIAHVYTKTVGRIVFNRCDAATFFYDSLAEKAHSLGVPSHKIHVIPNAVEITLFNTSLDTYTARERLGIDPDKKVLLSVGRLVPVKQIETLIKVTRMLVKEGMNIVTYYVGDGPYRHVYEKIAKDLKDTFIFLGTVPYAEVPEIMAACDVFLLPSLSEGLPTVILEAGAVKKPVVASNVGGIPDIITHGVSGFLAEPEDTYAFFEYTKQLLQDESLAGNIAAKLHHNVVHNFSWDKISHQYHEVYQQVVQDRQ